MEACSAAHFLVGFCEIKATTWLCTKRRISSIEELTHQADVWNQRTNHAKTTIDWTFTPEKARLKLKYKLKRS